MSVCLSVCLSLIACLLHYSDVHSLLTPHSSLPSSHSPLLPPLVQVKLVDGDRPAMGDSYLAGGASRGPGGGLIPSTPFLTAQTPQHLSGSETPSLYGNMTPK